MLGSSLNKFEVQRLCLLHLALRNLQLLASTVLVGEAVHLHHQNIDERIEAYALIYRILNDNRLNRRLILDSLESTLERSLLGVELIDYGDKRLIQDTGITALDDITNLPAGLRIYEHNAHIAHLKCREEVSAEVVRTRTVDDIEFAAHKLGEEGGRIDRTLVFVLDVGVVRQGVVIFDTTSTVDNLTFVSHSLCQGSFTRAWGSNQNDVLNLFW